MARRVACALWCVFLLRSLSYAQDSSSLGGIVTDPSGRVVPAVDISATNIDTGAPANTKTNGVGIYGLPALQSGHYRVTVNKQGFKQIIVPNVTLQVADTATRNFQLEVGSASESITVVGENININATDGSVSTVIDRDFVDEMPLNGRSLQNLVLLVPGVVASTPISGIFGNGFSVNGNRDTSSANWTVDGASANMTTNGANVSPDALTAGTTVLGTTQSLISLDALQEFRVTTSSYSVEYGVSPGAQIQFQSRAGTNQFHGVLFDYFRNTIFDANDWFANNKGLRQAAEHQNDFGGTFGGPVIVPHLYNGHDKAFFFFNYEGLRLLQPVTLADESSPTAAFRQSAPAALQPILNSLPLPNGPLYGNGWGVWTNNFSEPSQIDSWSLRGDYILNGWTKLFARFSNSPSSDSDIGDGTFGKSALSMLTATVGVTMTPSSRIANDLRLNFSRSKDVDYESPLPPINGSDPSGAAAALAPPAQFATGGFQENIEFTDPSFKDFPEVGNLVSGSHLRQWDIVDTLQWQLARHQLKAGFEWNLHKAGQLPAAYVTFYEFESLASIEKSIPDSAKVQAAPNSIDTVIPRSAFYLGDTWKANKRLSVEYGIRWELPFAPHYEGGYTPLLVTSIANLLHPVLNEQNQLYNTSYRNFAPRLGVAYLLEDRTNYQIVLRGGGGLFYNTETLLGGVAGFPFSETTVIPKGTPYPAPASYLVPPPSTGAYTPAQLATQIITGINQHLALPRVWQWNLALEQQLGANQSLTMGYVGSAGRRLYTSSTYYPAGIEDTQFRTNGTESDYAALQVKFNRQVSRGLRSLVSYTWSHSLDDNSANNYGFLPLWGNSNFDVRHAISVASVYTLPSAQSNRLLKAVTSGWLLSENFNSHTGSPVMLQGGEPPDIVGNGSPFVFLNVVPGLPIYLHGSQYPGGTRLNPSAFQTPPAGQYGNSGRNQFRNQGFWQVDTGLQRQFALGEKAGRLRVRIDAFNLLNHPNFGGYVAIAFSNPTPTSSFGLPNRMLNEVNSETISPLYGSGGPRSLQLSLRYEF